MSPARKIVHSHTLPVRAHGYAGRTGKEQQGTGKIFAGNMKFKTPIRSMKRLLLLIFAFFLLSGTSHAAHIKGGFFTYEYLGPGSGTNLRYHITLTVYMLCNPSMGQL